MFRFPDYFFFKPNQNLENVFEILIFLCLLVGCILLLYMVYSYYHKFLIKNKDVKKFRLLTDRYGLTHKEGSLLLRLSKEAHLEPIARILHEAEWFEKLARPVEETGRRYERWMVQSIREKLFGKILTENESIRSTRDLIPGIRLFIKYVDRKNVSLWGHLIDVERDGLIVVIPSYHEVRVPLRPDTRLEITAMIPHHHPLIFRTWVKSVIPGPRKMVILGHSDFVIESQDSNSITMAPNAIQSQWNEALEPPLKRHMISKT